MRAGDRQHIYASSKPSSSRCKYSDRLLIHFFNAAMMTTVTLSFRSTFAAKMHAYGHINIPPINTHYNCITMTTRTLIILRESFILSPPNASMISMRGRPVTKRMMSELFACSIDGMHRSHSQPLSYLEEPKDHNLPTDLGKELGCIICVNQILNAQASAHVWRVYYYPSEYNEGCVGLSLHKSLYFNLILIC